MNKIRSIASLLCVIFASSVPGGAKPAKKSPPIDAAVPKQAFLTVSARIGKLLEKADYDERLNWRPAIENDPSIPKSVKHLVRDPNSLGLNLNAPTHFFAQLGGEESSGLIIGALALVENPKVLNEHLDALSKVFGIEPRKNHGLTIRAKTGLPFLTAQRGRILLLLFAAPSAMESPLIEDKDEPLDIAERLIDLSQNILKAKKEGGAETVLASHLARPYDLALYFDHSNFTQFARRYAPDEQFGRILEISKALDSNFSLATLFNNGLFTLKLQHFIGGETRLFAGPIEEGLVDLLPNDAISYGGFSLDQSVLKEFLRSVLQVETEKSDEENSTILPVPELGFSPFEVLDAFDGDFVFALSQHRKATPIMTSGALPDWTQAPAAFFLGANIGDPRKLDVLLSYANKSNLLSYALSASDLSLERADERLFVTTADHRRELMSGRPLRPLPKKLRTAIARGPLTAKLDFRALARSLREAMVPHYEFLMGMDVLEEFDKITLSLDGNGDHLLRVFLRDKERNALATLAQRMETEFTDRRNTELFRAIASNDLRGVDRQIRQGSLINAPDRSGHTPMHFAAYRGSAEIFEYLLRNGGRIDVRGRHQGTPLHSAAWGRNQKVVEILIENGADVNAKSDEGETPAMTDPQARDKYDTGLLELAAAGGHADIFEKLKAIGVKSKYPFHVAAGLGDEKTIRKLVSSGTPVDQRDGFGGTPLLFATISGKREIFDYLLSKKANPKIVASEGYTLMHAAAFAKDKALISLLLDLGLDVNARHGEDGITPVDVAHEDDEAVELLRLHGGKTSWELGRP